MKCQNSIHQRRLILQDKLLGFWVPLKLRKFHIHQKRNAHNKWYCQGKSIFILNQSIIQLNWTPNPNKTLLHPKMLSSCVVCSPAKISCAHDCDHTAARWTALPSYTSLAFLTFAWSYLTFSPSLCRSTNRFIFFLTLCLLLKTCAAWQDF